ncbi:hypothetical protein Q5O14_07330 [Eubacteriaceae bacterium ES2]|nr:hypothetical protein Q5O14_07330 [Eubacteriaceae bacterium ES2]
MKDLSINIKPKINNNPIEIKKAYLNLFVFLCFYLMISALNGILPYNLTVVGIVSIMQLLVCVQLTFNIRNCNKTASLFLMLLSVLIINCADEFNRIICESANLSVMIHLSNLLFFTIHYYKVLIQNKGVNKLSFF